MIKNFFTLAFRNYMRNKSFVIINVLGLGIAIACCIVAYLNYKFDADYNKMHVNRETIFKVNQSRYIKDRLQDYSATPVSLAPAIENDFAGIERISRFSRGFSPIRYEAPDREIKIFNEGIAFADKEFLRMFTFPMKWGDSTAFEDEGKMLISEKISEKFFGDENPVGESITLFDNEGVGVVFTIGGVFKNIPENSIVRFEILSLYSNYLKIYKIDEFDWKSWAGGTFLQVSNPEQVKEIEKSLSKYLPLQNKAREDWIVERFYIQTLDEFTNDARDLWANWIGSKSPPAAIITPIIMALLILLLACFNFINTAIASSNKRLKEIGIRKVVGSHRKGLIIQFLGENTIICFFALLVSLIIGVFLVNEWDKMWAEEIIGKDFLNSLGVWFFLAITLVFTAILSALYPAVYISSFNPTQVLKGDIKFSGKSLLSRILLVLQFSISIIGLISSLVFTQNANYQNNFEYGYNKEDIIVVQAGSNENLELLRANLESNPGILQMAKTSHNLAWTSLTRTATSVDKNAEVLLFNLHTDYCGVMGLKFAQGRDFTPEFELSDVNRSTIVNETLVNEFGWDDPIGKTVKLDSLNLTVVGVVKDFVQNLWTPVKPMVFRKVPKDDTGTLIVKGGEENIVALNDQIKAVWDELIPNAPYGGAPLDNFDEGSIALNKNIQKMYNFLTIVGIFLSIVALYTLVSLNILKRTKEVGMRKVLGAPSMQINHLIGKPFILMILIASVIGGATGYYMSVMLLDSIWKHHIIVGTLSVLVPIVITLLLAYVTLTSKVLYTLSKNPVQSLRYE
jgi:ABC-type antimicrobial peptide transport system permease subunit